MATCKCVKPTGEKVPYNPCSNGDCQLLSDYAKIGNNVTNDTVFKFLGGNHTLNCAIMAVKGVRNLTLSIAGPRNSRHQHQPTVQCNGSKSGFWFKDIVNLKIEGLNFENCGFSHGNYSQALFIESAVNLQLSDLWINQAIGNGIYIFNLMGYSSIKSIHINGSHNAASCRASNMLMIYNDTSSLSMTKSSLLIYSSVFSYGRACSGNKTFASGVTVFLETTNAIQITFLNCTLLGNVACDGGNMAISYVHLDETKTWTSSVIVNSCIFSLGSAELGGGMYLRVKSHEHKLTNPRKAVDIVNITNSVFERNTAAVVGGGMYIELYEEVSLSTAAHIHIHNSNFCQNSVKEFKNGRGGVALSVLNFQVPGYLHHRLPQYILSVISCSFHENRVGVLPSEKTVGSGALYIEENAITNMIDNWIADNHCTGVVAIRSNLVLKGNNTIFNNIGGIVLCDNSIMYLHDDVRVNISHNTALSFGGGIYAEFDCTQAIPPCFFQFHNMGNKTLEENSANISGSALYGGSIEHCYFLGPYNPQNSTKIFFDVFRITKDGIDDDSYITSNPLRVCFCTNDSSKMVKNCSEFVRHYTIYPGGMLSVSLVVVGQMNGAVPGIVIASNVSSEKSTQLINTTVCTNLSYTLSPTVIKSSIGHSVDITLTVQNTDFREAINTMDSITLSVEVQKCPLGFELQDPCTGEQCECVCQNALQSLDGVECNITSVTIHKNSHSYSWFGTTDNRNQIVSYPFCPFDFCNQQLAHDINISNLISLDEQCAYNRSGILCGVCRKNLSHVLGSSQCFDCSSDYAILRVIVLVIAFALAGIVLVLFLGVVDLTVAEGTLNGVIFYMNVISVNRSIFFIIPKRNYVLPFFIGMLKGFVSWMNLDLGINTCFYDGMKPFGKAILQFFFPLYLWFIAGLVIILCRKSIRLSNLLGNNAVRVLASIILLSYAKLVRAAIDVLYHTPLYNYDSRSGSFTHYTSVWRIDGNMLYFGAQHAILLALAGLVAAVTLPFTLALTFIQCLRKKSNIRALFWVNKLKPFFDAYTGPYKDKYHFWTGFLLMVRLTLFTAIAINDSTKGPAMNIMLVGVTASLLSLFIQVGIYRRVAITAIEAFTYSNLAIFCIGTAYSSKHDNTVFFILCIGSMFFLFCGVVVYHVLVKLSNTHKWEVMKAWLLEKRWPWMKKNHVIPLIFPDAETDTDDEVDVHDAIPSAHYTRCREPTTIN